MIRCVRVTWEKVPTGKVVRRKVVGGQIVLTKAFGEFLGVQNDSSLCAPREALTIPWRAAGGRLTENGRYSKKKRVYSCQSAGNGLHSRSTL
jgi:hypothetical protein